MSPADRIADIVRTLDWVASGLSEDGIDCSDLAKAADDLNALKLEIQREAFTAQRVPA
jgi:hypothetical protein